MEGKWNETGKWFKVIFGLSYLKPNHVGDCFAFSFDEAHLINPKVIQYVDYLILNNIEDDVKFPPNMSAKPDASPKNTKNVCKSFHLPH